MTELVIRLPGEPIPQNQGKIGRWKAKDGREGATIRQPTKVRHYKLDLQEAMYRAAVDAGWPEEQARLAGVEENLGRKTFFGDQPLALSITAVFSCPVSQHRKTKPVPRRWHTGRYGNCDNLTKPVGDAGEGVLWDDDGQIAEILVRKLIGAQGEAPYIEIRVRSLDQSPNFDAIVRAAVGLDGASNHLPAPQPALFEEER